MNRILMTSAIGWMLLAPASVHGQRPVQDPDAFVARDRRTEVEASLEATCTWAGPATVPVHNRLVSQVDAASELAARDSLERTLLCIRARMYLNGARTHVLSSPQSQPSWPELLHASARAFLARNPLDESGLVVLAAIGLLEGSYQRFAAWELPRGQKGQHEDVLGFGSGLPEIVYAIRHGVSHGRILRACTSLAIDAGDYATARDCSIRALDLGADSTWHHLRLAAIAAWVRDTTPAIAHFLKALAASQGTSDREEVGWHLELPWVSRDHCYECRPNGVLSVGPLPRGGLLNRLPRFSREERARFRSLPSEGLAKWLFAKLAQANADSLDADLRRIAW